MKEHYIKKNANRTSRKVSGDVSSILQDETVGQRSASSSSISTPIVEDTSPESAVGKKSESPAVIDTGKSNQIRYLKSLVFFVIMYNICSL